MRIRPWRPRLVLNATLLLTLAIAVLAPVSAAPTVTVTQALSVDGSIPAASDITCTCALSVDSWWLHNLPMAGARSVLIEDRTTAWSEPAGPGSQAATLVGQVLAQAAGAPMAPATPRGTVFLIVMENHDWGDFAGSPDAPYLNSTVLPQASYATDDTAIPGSLPNYLHLLGGQCYDYCASEDPPSTLIAGPSLLAQLDAAGLSWAAYEESIAPGTCPTQDAYPYLVRHDPFVYFAAVSESTVSCTAHVHPYGDLAGALAQDTVPRFVFITPNACDDGHDACAPISNTVRQTDAWLAYQLPAILRSAAYKRDGVVILTWDEGSTAAGPIPLIVLSPLAKGGGYHNALPYSHDAVLRTVEEYFGLHAYLGAAADVPDLGDLFRSWPPQ